MAVLEEDWGQEGKKSVTETLKSVDDQVKLITYSTASTQITQPRLAKNSTLPRLPKLSSELKLVPDHLVALKFWQGEYKDTQKSEELPRTSIIGFFKNQSTDNKMATTKTDAKEKLDAQVKSVDMSDEMQLEAIEVAQEAMSKYSIEKDIAMHIKKTFDERKGPTWHCIVGRNFGSFVTHETKHFIYFYLGHCAILLFKTQ